jgi:hypothetical protein
MSDKYDSQAAAAISQRQDQGKTNPPILWITAEITFWKARIQPCFQGETHLCLIFKHPIKALKSNGNFFDP